jgi:hypothetical protein
VFVTSKHEQYCKKINKFLSPFEGHNPKLIARVANDENADARLRYQRHSNQIQSFSFGPSI